MGTSDGALRGLDAAVGSGSVMLEADNALIGSANSDYVSSSWISDNLSSSWCVVVVPAQFASFQLWVDNFFSLLAVYGAPSALGLSARVPIEIGLAGACSQKEGGGGSAMVVSIDVTAEFNRRLTYAEICRRRSSCDASTLHSCQ